MSFARFKRPVPSNYQLSQPQANFAYNTSEYKEGYPVYSSRGVRNSSQSIRRPSREKDRPLILHQKTNSQGNLLHKGLNNTLTYDEKPSAYQNNQQDYIPEMVKREVANPSLQAQPKNISSSHSHRRTSSYNPKMGRPVENLNQTISYEDRTNALPVVGNLKASESPKITKSYSNLRAKAGNKLYDSLDQYVSDHGKFGLRNSDFQPFAKLYLEFNLDYLPQNNARAKLRSSLAALPQPKFMNVTTREDVQRQSLEQDRYYSRLNQMNSKQQLIFEKYLVEQLVPVKDKEKTLEEIERK